MTALRKATTNEATISDRVATLINGLTIEDLEAWGAWQPLADLSARTILEAVDVEPGSIVLNESQFEATANVYVLLNYGSQEDDASLSDEYIATIKGRISQEYPAIEAVFIDVSPFYS